jgi:hypothetical protein
MNILIGCPYNGIKELEKSLLKIKSPNDAIFNVDDIVAINDKNFYFKNDKILNIEDITVSFVRYPYDLIPPHNESYLLRENTEFFKTIAILLGDSAVNKFSQSHIARNRIFSLDAASKSGLKVPSSLAMKGVGNNRLDKVINNDVITKSLGNCYFSEGKEGVSKFAKRVLLFEEDGGETAYIYPAHQIQDKESFSDYIDNFGTVFVQDKISGDEYRIFVIGDKILFYERNKKNMINSIDKSGNILEKCDIPIGRGEQKKLLELSKNLNLNYLCLDAIINGVKDFIVIDVNPFGSFPEHIKDSDVTDELANFIYSFK